MYKDTRYHTLFFSCSKYLVINSNEIIMYLFLIKDTQIKIFSKSGRNKIKMLIMDRNKSNEYLTNFIIAAVYLHANVICTIRRRKRFQRSIKLNIHRLEFYLSGIKKKDGISR